ncbi:polysaccharide pyruvyl transferase family protein [Amycolatopsis sp. WAC 04169]|uniref:polysaccharide pyruvyl transferase family protein n=1 Tax=Amycolatopsis sp. WAC 04169 TaxID=2203197 RepID=UPI000F7739CE|nr:polysaccharide pyruvyl transferase family protein [Amycolatopsis sp. WAC 04169]RSN25613.1 polysaccharide pyruvyl transferase family protein [Amycolatopsis sp. WAC 04169]
MTFDGSAGEGGDSPTRAPRPRRRHYLIGPSGFPNFGDELIAATWLRYLARTEPEADVWLDTHSPGPAQLLLNDLHPRLRCTDTLWRLCGEAPSDDPWEVANWVQSAVNDPGLAPRWDAGIDLLGRTDVLHLIGGGYLNALWPRHIGLLAGAAAAARRSGARTAMTGQGLTPFPPGATDLLRSLVDRFDVVDVRDDPSAELLPGVARTCDDVFLEPPEQRPAAQAREFVLCVQSDIGAFEPSVLASQVLGLLRAWEVDPEQLAVVEGIPRVDRAVPALLEHELAGAEFHPFRDIWRHGLPLAPGQTWISSRYHLHLVAAAAGAAGLAFSVSRGYYTTKHRSLIDLGSGWTSFDAEEGGTPDRPTGTGFPPHVLRRCRDLKRSVATAVYGHQVAEEVRPATRRLALRSWRTRSS